MRKNGRRFRVYFYNEFKDDTSVGGKPKEIAELLTFCYAVLTDSRTYKLFIHLSHTVTQQQL